MLHILLLILKIIGIILAVILGILLLLVCVILFVPVRYELTGKCDGTIESLMVKMKVTWLLRLLRADVLVKGKKMKWQVRAAWIKKSKAVIFGEKKDDVSNEEQKDEEHQESEMVQKNEEHQENEVVQKDEKKSEEDSETDKTIKDKTIEDKAVKDKTINEESTKKSFSDKIKEKYEKIKNSLNDLQKKKEKILDFLTDKSHIHAYEKIKKECLVLLKKLKPEKLNIKIRFGFDDPGLTGKVLGGLAVIYPLLGDTMEINPDFENQILKGNVYLKGKIRFCHFAGLALKLIICKDIRSSYKDIRNFKL